MVAMRQNLRHTSTTAAVGSAVSEPLQNIITQGIGAGLVQAAYIALRVCCQIAATRRLPIFDGAACRFGREITTQISGALACSTLAERNRGEQTVNGIYHSC